MKGTACIPASFYITITLAVLVPSLAQAQNGTPERKPVIRTQSDLPRYTYDLPTSSASELLTDDAAFDEVAARVRADLEALLEAYTVEDKATLRALYGTLESLALLREDVGATLDYTAKVRELQEKPADRLTSGLVRKAVVAAKRAGGDEASRRDAFHEAYSAAVDTLPWEVVQDVIKQNKGQAEMLSQNLLVGLAQSQYDPAAMETGQISGETARALIGMREYIEMVLPYQEEMVEVLQAYIDANHAEKPNIWAERDAVLTETDDLHPVVIGIWDSGVDGAVFGTNMFRNEDEAINGQDDDGNGFVDDVSGIAYGLWGGEPSSELLYPLGVEARERLPQMKDQMKGYFDMQASLDSPEAQVLKRRIAQMQPAEVQPFVEELGLFGIYLHGTHVAGIAAAGNPAARILVVRETFSHQTIPPPILKEEAERWAANMQRSVDYLKRHNARVVNMSWGASAKQIESMYEANGIGASAEERQRMAQEVFDILLVGMREAMQSAPGILFVPAAGNSNEDIGFMVDIPAAIDLPNVLSVGAVDQAGEETSFTSYGESVRVHANGYEVESYLPGGERLAASGTSMAAPNVTNLAGKLFALDPSLTPEEVIDIILAGADRSEDGRRVLINPRRSVELLKVRTS